jgi:hypothetical protein
MYRVLDSAAARWPHVALSSVLALGAIGLIVGAAWIGGIPTSLCDEGVASPSGWIYAGFILFALGLPACVFWGTLRLHEDVHRYYIAVAIGEALISLALMGYLSSKYGHYQCG